MAQLSHPYTTTGKAIALTIRTFVSKVVSLIFNALYKFISDHISNGFLLLADVTTGTSLVVLIRTKSSQAACGSDFLNSSTPKSLRMVIAAMKLKDAYSLEGRL